MADLTATEIWFIKVYFKDHAGFSGSHLIPEIRTHMQHLVTGSYRILCSLIVKRVLDLSPDKTQVKFTDYGLELYKAVERAQGDWEKQPIIKISNLDRDQILIRSGETFRANRVPREILQQVHTEFYVIDPYLGPGIFDLIEDINPKLKARLLSSDRAPKTLTTSFRAFRDQYPTADLRITDENKIHDRYILWDDSKALHVGHSLKDLGQTDTQINVVKDARPQFQLFQERWKEAREVV
jgi:hypothetical protein